MSSDTARAAAAWHMVHEQNMSLTQVAKARGTGTMAVGGLFAGHKRDLDARELALRGPTIVPETS